MAGGGRGGGLPSSSVVWWLLPVSLVLVMVELPLIIVPWLFGREYLLLERLMAAVGAISFKVLSSIFAALHTNELVMSSSLVDDLLPGKVSNLCIKAPSIIFLYFILGSLTINEDLSKLIL